MKERRYAPSEGGTARTYGSHWSFAGAKLHSSWQDLAERGHLALDWAKGHEPSPRESDRLKERRYAPSEGGTARTYGSHWSFAGAKLHSSWRDLAERGHLALDWAKGHEPSPRESDRLKERRYAPSEGGTARTYGSHWSFAGAKLHSSWRDLAERGHLALDWAKGHEPSPRESDRLKERRYAPSEGGTPSLRGVTPVSGEIPERGHLALDWAVGMRSPSGESEFVPCKGA